LYYNLNLVFIANMFIKSRECYQKCLLLCIIVLTIIVLYVILEFINELNINQW